MTATKHKRRLAVAAVMLMALALPGCGIIGGKEKAKTPTIGNRVPILSRIESGARVDPALAGVSVILPPAETNPDWPQAGGTASKAYGHLALGETPQPDLDRPRRRFDQQAPACRSAGDRRRQAVRHGHQRRGDRVRRRQRRPAVVEQLQHLGRRQELGVRRRRQL